MPLQDLLDQVVDDVAVVACEAGDELGRVASTLHRERRELEGGDPAFGARLERGDVRACQVQTHHLVEIGDRLVGREPEVDRTDLRELAPCAEAGERESRIGARGDHHVHLRRQVLEQERDPLVDVLRVDEVVVVEHEDEPLRRRAELIHQGREDRLDRRRLRLPQQGERGRADSRSHRLQGGDDIGPEGRRLAVAGVEREPGRRPRIVRDACQPLRQQRRLAEAGRCRDERQLELGPATQSLDQSRTSDDCRAAAWGCRAWSRAAGLASRPWASPWTDGPLGRLPSIAHHVARGPMSRRRRRRKRCSSAGPRSVSRRDARPASAS